MQYFKNNLFYQLMLSSVLNQRFYTKKKKKLCCSVGNMGLLQKCPIKTIKRLLAFAEKNNATINLHA